MKRKLSRFLITFFFGMFGIHKFIDGKIGMGILYFLTFGIFGVGWLLDIFKILFPYQNHSTTISNLSDNFNNTNMIGLNNCNSNTKLPKNNLDRASLLEWQQLLIPGSDQLHLTIKQLQQQTDIAIDTHMRIMHDCQHIILTTTNIQVFFERYTLLIEKLSILQSLKNFMDIADYRYRFTEDYDYLLTQYINDKQFFIKQLFDRCWNEAIIKADSLKTAKGKRNQFDKLMSRFVTYKKQMTNATIQYCLDKYFNRFEQHYSYFDTTDDYENIEIDDINDFTNYDVD